MSEWGENNQKVILLNVEKKRARRKIVRNENEWKLKWFRKKWTSEKDWVGEKKRNEWGKLE